MAEEVINIIQNNDDKDFITEKVREHLLKLVGSLDRPIKKLSRTERRNAAAEVERIINEIQARFKSDSLMFLFGALRLCVDYFDHLCSDKVLVASPYANLWSRTKLIRCYELRERFKKVETEAKYLLEQIDKLSENEGGGSKQSVLPRPTARTRNSNVAMLVMSAAFSFLNAWNEKEIVDYTKIHLLVMECDPWLRLVQSDKYKQLQGWIGKFLSNCTESLVKRRKSGEMKLTVAFCNEAFFHHEKASSGYDVMAEFGRRILNTFFSTLGDEYFGYTSIVQAVLKNMTEQTKQHSKTESNFKQFIELVSYSVVNYGKLKGDHCHRVAQILYDSGIRDFIEDNLLHVGLALEHCAIALVIDDFNECKELLESNSIVGVLAKIERHLADSANIHELKEPTIAHFFCEQLSTLIISNCNLLCEVKDNNTLPTFEEVFGRYTDDFLANSQSEMNELVNKAANQHAVEVAISFCILELATKKDTEPLWMLVRLMNEGKPDGDVLESIYQHLHKMFQVFHSSARLPEAIQILDKCCETAWSHLLWSCQILKTNEYTISKTFLANNSMDDLVRTASEDSALLISLLNKDSENDLDSMVITCVQRWVFAYKEFEICSPIAIIKIWLEIQYKQIKEEVRDVRTIYALVPELQSTEHICGTIILETEFETNKNMYHENSTVSSMMENEIREILLKIRTGEDSFCRYERLVLGGLRLVSCGTKGQTESLEYIYKAINLLLDLKNQQEDMHEKINHLLFKAYCSVALCGRIAFPESKRFIDDIKIMKTWLNKENLQAGDIDMAYFFYIADLLSLEGYTKLYSDIMRCIVGFDRDLWNLCWQSGNLRHCLCVSVLDDEFIEILSKEDSLCDKVLFRNICVESEPLRVGFEQSWSLLPTISVDSKNGSLATTINEVKDAATTLTNIDGVSKNPFAASRLYFDLTEKLIANGLMFEALYYANIVYELRMELLSERFIMEWKEQIESVVIQEDTFKIQNYIFRNFDMRPSYIRPRESYGFGTGNCIYVPTPWNIVRCYLESALQIAAIHEIMGNADEAEKKLAFGKQIASKLNLRVFVVRFSTALAKIYHTKHYRSLALIELEYAQKELKSMINPVSCYKCKLISWAKINQVNGDVCLSDFNPDKAHECYASAKNNLEEPEWTNVVSVPTEASSTNIVFCKAFAILSETTAVESECWHCQPSVITKSLSLRRHIDLKWECSRRRHLIILQSKIAKCARLKRDTKNELKHLMAGVSMLFLRSISQELVVSSSLLEELVKNSVIADIFTVENASILYKICRFSLKRLFDEDASEPNMTIFTRESIVSGLKLAFILSRKVLPLHQKVSRLLAMVYAFFSKEDTLSAVAPSVTVTQWATYFHQASVGALVNHYLLSQEAHHINVHDNGFNYALAPCHVMKLEEHVAEFFKMLPKVDIICISLLKDNSEEKLFHKLLSSSLTSTWMVLSRLSLNNGVVCIILPIGKILTGYSSNKPESWLRCPWADTVFDKVAPVLKGILEEATRLRDEDSEHKLDKLRDLDSSLHKFLSEVEKYWLGPWKQLFLGQWSGCTNLDDMTNKLRDDLEQKGHMAYVDEKYLKLVIQGAGDDHEAELMTELLINKGCFIGKGNRNDNDTACLDFISNTLKESLGKIQLKHDQCREPVILVPDVNVQMLPFESLPVLQEKEVYRMPSVAFIAHKTISNRNLTMLPTMNPSNCYYLINPACDLPLKYVQKDFERWSTTLGFEGDADTVPSLNTLKEALKKRDLFVYLGHSSGTKYISGEEILKIEGCASAQLMGCRSVYISYSSKTCIPEGAPLYFLLAGSKVVVGYLWAVYTNDLQRGASAFFGSLVKAKTATSILCSQRTARDADAQATQISKKRKHCDGTSNPDTCTSLCKHEFNLGSFILKAREAGTDKYLHGAALVIYGLPTCIDVTSE